MRAADGSPAPPPGAVVGVSDGVGLLFWPARRSELPGPPEEALRQLAPEKPREPGSMKSAAAKRSRPKARGMSSGDLSFMGG